MNQNMIIGAIALFVIPIGFVFCWNFDQLVMGVNPDAKPQGTLLYFYTDS